MRQAYLEIGASNPSLRAWKLGRLAWTGAAVSILAAIAALGIAARGVLTSGEYRLILSHQTLTPFITIVYGITGALVASRRPRNPTGWIFVSVGLLYGLSALATSMRVYGAYSSPVHAWAVWFSNWLWIPAIFLPMTFVLLLFPDGHLLSPRWGFVGWSTALGLAITVLVVMLHPGPLAAWGVAANPIGLPEAAPLLDRLVNLASALLFTGLIGSIAGFSIRFRRSAGIEREQMKWMVYAMGIVGLDFILSAIAWFYWPDNPLVNEIGISLTSLGVLGIAVSATITILRFKLYDINLIINRTLVYSALTVGVAALYGLVVGALGALFQASGNLLLSLLATGLAAILFQPMRDWLQHAANRLMYGERDDPYAVLSGLSRRLEASLTPEAALPVVVETVAQALKLPYVAIALKQEGDFKIAASYGAAEGETVQLPLFHQGETVGHLRLAARSPNELFTPGEQRLLKDIARHVGVTAHTVLLAQELRALAEDLQRSRARLVTAREEERRRLRRDLHDGLGPVLASQGLKLAALQRLWERGSPAAANLLDQLIARNEDVVAEIRRLVYDLRPPALDELGLVAAVRDQVIGANEDLGMHLPVQIHVEAPAAGLPPLPAAVEGAAYRIALEALTNVYRHAQAQSCTVRFSIEAASSNQTLLLEICDDGLGLPEQYRHGVGLASMKERAEEVGGKCAVVRLQEGGTRVLARFPLYP